MASANLVTISSRVRRLTAPNPGPLTGAGTNTYIVGQQHLSVIDPGPADPLHIQAIMDVCGDALEYIFVTHTHADHSPGAALLAQQTGAKVIGLPLKPDDGKQDKSFNADIQPAHENLYGPSEYSLRALVTPGHVGNHVCYMLEEEKMVFAGDHMMNGSTVVIIPPSGDMGDYIASLQLLKGRDPHTIAPGHGEPILDARKAIDTLIDHRLQREAKVYAALRGIGGVSLGALVEFAYDDVEPALHPIAVYSLHAHLLKLEKDNRVLRIGQSGQVFTDDCWTCVND